MCFIYKEVIVKVKFIILFSLFSLTSCSSTEFRESLAQVLREANCEQFGKRDTCEKAGITGIEYEYVLRDIQRKKELESAAAGARAGVKAGEKRLKSMGY
jgi:hypothetical protein